MREAGANPYSANRRKSQAAVEKNTEGEESEAEVSDLNRQYWKLRGVSDPKDDIDYLEPRNLWLVVSELDRVLKYYRVYRGDLWVIEWTEGDHTKKYPKVDGTTFREAALKALIAKLKGSS